MPFDTSILNLPDFVIKNIHNLDPVLIDLEYRGEKICPFCSSGNLRIKDTFTRKVRHESIGKRMTFLLIKSHKYICKSCGKYFNQRFPGILRYKRSTEGFRREIFQQHHYGICQTTLSSIFGMGSATVERWYHELLERKMREMKNNPCPRIMGIDEHFFTRKRGYATTICDLEHHRVFDIALGRSESSLNPYFTQLADRDNVRVVLMDLADPYRLLVRKYFPKAKIVADRFHVVRLINHHFLKLWQQIDPVGRRNRGLLSLMRRHEKNLSPKQKDHLKRYFIEHPEMDAIYGFKQKLVRLMLIKHKTKRECRRLIPIFLDYIERLKNAVFEPMITLGKTLDSWREEVVRMWRFTKTNSITEGFHNKMEMISRRAFGFRNFENYRLRVKVLCA